MIPVTILAVIGMIILLPILYFVPLGLAFKEKYIIAAAAFIFTFVGNASWGIFPIWQTGLILLLLIILFSYLFEKRTVHFLAKAELAATEAADFEPASNRYTEVEGTEIHQLLISHKQLEAEKTPFSNIMGDEKEEKESREADVQDESRDPLLEPIKQLDFTVQEVEKNIVNKEESIEDIGDAILQDEETLLENILLEDLSLVAAEEMEPSEIAGIEHLPSIEDILNTNMLEAECLKEDNELHSSGTPGYDQEPELSEIEMLLLDIEGHDDSLMDEVELMLPEEDIRVVESLANEGIKESSVDDDSVLEEILLVGAEIIAPLEKENIEIMDNNHSSETVLSEIEEERKVNPLEHTNTKFPSLSNEEITLLTGMQDNSAGEDDEVLDLKAEITENQSSGVNIQKDLFSSLVEEVLLLKHRLNHNEYEKLLIQYLEPSLPDQHYLTFAQLLIEHYISVQKYSTLAVFLNSIQPRFNTYPVVNAELEHLMKRIENK
jgi:hypothetical protein